jgi:predicted ATP-grasp superfamily ATP-dependent carboligase
LGGKSFSEVASRPLDVLLLDAQYRQALTCLRVYGRAGMRLGAAACRSDLVRATAFHSRWCSLSSVLPDLAGDAEDYVDSVLELIKHTSPGMVLPAHDGSIELLAARRDEVERHCALPLASDEAMAIAMSKPRTLALATGLGIPTPKSIRVGAASDLVEALGTTGLPAVVKPITSWTVGPSGEGTRLVCGLVRTRDETERKLNGILEAGGDGALLQPWLPGRREAVTVFRARGRVWARFAQVSHREWPALGGVSVLCESVCLPPDIAIHAERLVEAMDLDGCAMVEFRRDRDGTPVLMEVNPRMGSSVALAVRAGVNFPGLLHSWAMGEPISPITDYRQGVRLHWLIGDLWYINSAMWGDDYPEIPTATSAIRSLVADLVVRPGRPDLATLTDPRPGLADLMGTVGRHALPKARRGVRELIGRKRSSHP